jgi:hypothetical protein
LDGNRFQNAAAYAKNTGDFETQVLGFGILADAELYTDALQYLNTFPGSTNDVIDFITVQNINLAFLQNRENFFLSSNDESNLLFIGNKTTSTSGFARSLYLKLTGNEIPITFIYSGNNPDPRSVMKTEDNLRISSHPNPAQNDMYNVVITGEEVFKNYEIHIFDVQGKLVLRQPAGINTNSTIDLTGVSHGFYFVQVKESGRTLFTNKFIKM